MTKQETFDKVVSHLMTQKERSTQFGVRCAYRGAGDMKCAVGCLIPDDKYRADMEGLSVSTLAARFPELRLDHVELLGDLQYLHDNVSLDNWEIRLRNVALDHGLDFNWSPT